MKQEKNNRIDEFTNQFDELVAKGKMDINSLEQLMINNVENYKKDLQKQTEELLSTHTNEKELIVKKNKNGKKKGLN